VHAPPGSFVSWYFKKNGCGLVVDSPDVENLVSAIQKLISDEELRKKISSAAREAALRDFNAESIRAQFKEIVSPNRSLYKTSGDLG
jgi:glycosyltransferase involved in cell wall biosynthesis